MFWFSWVVIGGPPHAEVCVCVGGLDKIQGQEVDYGMKGNFIASLPWFKI